MNETLQGPRALDREQARPWDRGLPPDHAAEGRNRVSKAWDRRVLQGRWRSRKFSA